MHNQVKLQARNGMALLKTETANSRDIPHGCSASYSCCWQERKKQDLQMRMMANCWEPWREQRDCSFFPAFFRNQYDTCLEQNVRMQDSWVRILFSPFLYLMADRRYNKVLWVFKEGSTWGILMPHIINTKGWYIIS